MKRPPSTTSSRAKNASDDEFCAGEFGEYKRAAEPEKREKALIWRTAIGLQKVDELVPSKREQVREQLEVQHPFVEQCAGERK